MEKSEKPYVFISYAHVNNKIVLPAIQQLQARGVRLWYDSGIEAGSEWPEFVAEKVMNCKKFVLFISKAYLQSQNCKRELNFAISRKKEILSVFLEDVELSPGMEMQLGTYQAIFRNRFSGDKNFYTSVANEPFFNECRALPEATQTVDGGASQPEAPKVQTEQSQQEIPSFASVPALPVKSKVVAALLAIFLGGFGIHKFYLGKKVQGIVYLLLCWSYIPGFLGLIDGIIMLLQSEEKFTQKYKCKLK